MSNLDVAERHPPVVPAGRPVTTVLAGAFIVVCSAVAGLAAAIPDLVVTGRGVSTGWDYPPQVWALLLALTCAGAAVTTRARPAAVVAAIVAAQLAGNGLVMIRDWFTANGTGGDERYLLATLVVWAAVVPLAATAAAMTALALVWREPAGGWRALVPARPGYVVLGAAVTLLIPVVWGTLQEGRNIIPIGHAVLMYALPWGAGLASIGWLRGRPAVAAGLTVVLSALVCIALVVGSHLIAAYSPPPPVTD